MLLGYGHLPHTTHFLSTLVKSGEPSVQFSSAQFCPVQFSSVAAVQSCSDQLILVVVEGGGSNSDIWKIEICITLIIIIFKKSVLNLVTIINLMSNLKMILIIFWVFIESLLLNNQGTIQSIYNLPNSKTCFDYHQYIVHLLELYIATPT